MRAREQGLVGVVCLVVAGALSGCASNDWVGGFDPEDSGSPATDAGHDATTDGGPHRDTGAPDVSPSGDDDANGDDGGGDDASDAGSPDAAEGDSGADAGTDAGNDAGADAGHDAGPLDAGVDAADAGHDAGHDAGGVDAGGVDAGSLPSPVGKWSFEEGTGTTAADLSGHGHPATLKGAATWSAAGKIGSGLALDGATGYADVGVTLLDTSKAYTVSCWVSLTTVNAWEVVLSEDDVTGSIFGLKLRGDGSNQFDFDVELTDTVNPAFAVAQSATKATASTWTHLTGVYDPTGSGSLALYVNGVSEAKTAVGQAVLVATGHFLIGRGLYNAGAGSYVNGVIDEVEVRDVALTDAQVAALYAAEK